MKPTRLEDLRRPHPDQRRIDAETAALLRATWQVTRIRRVRSEGGAAANKTLPVPEPRA